MSRASAAAYARRAAPLFDALGDETRLRLLLSLSDGSPRSITRLTQRSRISRQAITKHLQVLSRAGLVRSTRLGRERVWELEPSRLLDAHRYLDQIGAEWEDALGRLAEFVEGKPGRPG